MPTITTLKQGGAPAVGRRQDIISNVIDLAANPYSSADVIECLTIPADTLVRNVGIEVLTAEGGTLTIEVGDGDAADTWDTGLNGNATGSTLCDGTSGLAKLYAAADTIDITLNNDADAAKIYIWADIADVAPLSTNGSA